MMSSRLRKARNKRGPLWRPDARERYRALLPELLLSILAVTCISIVMSYHEGDGVATLVIAASLTQIYVQGTLYTCTYLMEEDPGVNIAWMLMLPGGIMVSEAILGFTGLTSLYGNSLIYACPLSILVGTVFFYAARLRWTFIVFAVEMLFYVNLADELVAHEASLLFVHIACIFATTALFVMRTSATRITMSDDEERAIGETVSTGEWPSRTLGIYGQIAAFVVAVGLFCLTVAFAGTPAAWRGLVTNGTGSSEAVETTSPADVDATDVDLETETGQVTETNPMAEEAQGESATAAQPTNEETNPQPADDTVTPEPSRASTGGIPTPLLLLALVALSFPLRLLLRRLARFLLARERQATDRAAKIYLRILSRLDAVGISRNEAETPYEFLSVHEDELVELTAPAGMGLDEWMVLTDVYEKVRYAGLDPTEAELETCWRLYDALPGCARQALGWRHYLIGAFWNM